LIKKLLLNTGSKQKERIEMIVNHLIAEEKELPKKDDHPALFTK
jgi:hypothetical protein